MSAETPLHAAAHFGDPAGEAEAARAGAAVADVSAWGHFTLGGKDGPKFLQGLTTNDVLKLEEGRGCYTAFLNVHGRIETDCHVFRVGDVLVLQTPPERAAWLAQSLGRFRRAGDFRFAELAASHAAVAVLGPLGARALGGALGRDLGGFGPLDAASAAFDGAPVSVLGVPRSSGWSADVLGESAVIARLAEQLLGAGARPAGLDALETLRIEAAIPRFGRDFDTDTVLQELDVPDIVSFQKGCYLGQEVVARLHYLGQPSKLIRRLELPEGAVLPEPGDPVVAADGDADKVLGRVTSVALGSAGPVVLATVKRKAYAPGTGVRVRRGEALLPATVAARPAGGEEAR